VNPPAKTLRETRFASSRFDPIGVELLTLAELRARVPARKLLEAERVEFYMILVATAGQGAHHVDFQRLALRPGHVVFVRPGQVQQWQPANALEADLLLIHPAVVQPTTTARTAHRRSAALFRLEDWPAHFSTDRDGVAAWRSLAATLRRELGRPVLDEVSGAMARELVACLMLSMSRSATRNAAPATPQSQLIWRLRQELEALIHTRPTVSTLARRLRVSTSTLTRTCKSVLGHSAKEVVDRRVALEAQRLLVHTTSPSAAIGELLGFDEPTNFVKFFRRRLGTTPEAFRNVHRQYRG